MPMRKAGAKTAADPAVTDDVIEELRRRYDQLTQSQKRIAQYIVEHSQAVSLTLSGTTAVAVPVSEPEPQRHTEVAAPAIPTPLPACCGKREARLR